MTKKLAVVFSILIFVVSGLASYWFFSGKAATSKEEYEEIVSEETGATVLNGGPKTEACPLNGQLYSKAQRKRWEKRRPLGVVIENHVDARPQSGLLAADVIYEAVAEGGITRFLAMYLCEDSPTIGPVRSARIYYLKLLQGYGDYPLYSHVGGANTPGPADALGEIRDLGWDQYNDLNQFSVPFPIYYRDYERLQGRATEHTMYSSTQKLWEFAAKKRKLTNEDEDGKNWDKNFEPWKFKKDAPASERGSTIKISFDFWSQFGKTYAVTWLYDKNSNAYKRRNGGKDHVDKNTQKPLIAKNVVVVLADERPAGDGYPGGHLLYDIIGSGDGFLFQDGTATEITWRKNSEENALKFYSQGKEVELVAGKIFVVILPTGNEVEY